MPDSSPNTTANGAADLQENSPTGVGINTPQLTTSSNRPKRRAISDVNHVFLIIQNLQQARRSQNEKNGRIAAKLNSERPYSDEELKSEGLGYKSNISTKPLSTTIGKVAGRLVKALQSARYLTAAELPDSIFGAKEKTELFRSEITNLIRRWPGWFDFISLIATEDSTYGWTCAAWLDNTDWHPKPYRQDEAFFPDGTGHSIESVQVVCLRRFLQMHELAIMIEDRSAAEKAGWDINNTVESINKAMPPSIPGGNSAPYTDLRRYEDAIRESSVSLTLVNGAKQVEIWDVFATEIDGRISHYIVDNNTKKLLFEKEDRFKSITDCLTLFSYEQSNGKLLGSKGVGREIYEIAGALDRASNEAIDRLQMSGKLIITGPENQIDRFKLSVIGNVAIIPDGFTLSENKIESGIKEFEILDQLLTAKLNAIAGAVSPKEFDRERVTADEVNLYAAREEESRDDRDTRFIMQAASGLIGTITRRAMSSKVDDEDAIAVRKKLLAIMSEDEFDTLVRMSPIRTIEDFTALKSQQIIMFAEQHRQDPLYNQLKLQKKAASVAIDAEFADDVLLPENDPTEEAEQTRQQMLEDQLFQGDRPVPVSPRDNHLIHINVLKQDLVPLMHMCGQGDPKALRLVRLPLQHWSDHLAAAAKQGVDPKTLAPLEQELKQAAAQIGELQAHAQAQMQRQQAGAPPLPPIDAPQPPAPAGAGAPASP